MTVRPSDPPPSPPPPSDGSPTELRLTCVVEQAGDEGAVPEEGVRGGDVLKVALLEYGVFKHHGLHL